VVILHEVQIEIIVSKGSRVPAFHEKTTAVAEYFWFNQFDAWKRGIDDSHFIPFG
jgi:predicted LPLAT superfamily acyltransferase